MREPTRGIPFRLVDVFSGRRYAGNPLAVITDATGLATERMQQIAREFNFSETTFVLAPGAAGADFQVRIFTPGCELPFAGHPTLGTAFALVEERRKPLADPETRLVFEEGVGHVPVTVRNEGGRPGFVQLTAPLPEFGATFSDLGALAEMLSLERSDLAASARTEGTADFPLAQVVSCGVPFLFVPVRSLAAVRRIRFRPERWEDLRDVLPAPSVFAFTLEAEDHGSAAHGRMFDPGMGIAEDPATGAASAPLGCLLVRHGLVAREPVPQPAGHQRSTARVVLEQGYEIGRPSLLHVEVDCRGEEIVGVRVGGRCVSVGSGTLDV